MYLSELNEELRKIWPGNKRITIVCHGHSIPCGYMAENTVRPLEAYPQQLLGMLGDRFPHAVVSVITTAIGGENSISGAARFTEEVLCHKPDVVTIDYGRNDMFISGEEMVKSWSSMIEKSLAAGVKVILITPAIDSGEIYWSEGQRKQSDEEMSEHIRALADKYEVGLADANEAFCELIRCGHTRAEYCSSLNHINKEGHRIVACRILENFDY